MTTINGQTQILGLLGERINHSLSYQIHNHCLSSLNINAVYLPFQSTTPNPVWKLENFLGANVTMPFKQSIHQEMDSLTEAAIQIGSINTIHKIDNQLIGDNTDGIGFLTAMKAYNIEWTSRPVYILGAGGAAKAICWALKELGVYNIFAWNRTSERINQLNQIIRVKPWNCTVLPSNAIVVQCTPLGTQGIDPLAHIELHSNQIIIDLIYKTTPLLERLDKIGGMAINGMGMLIHQAAYSFSRWFQCPPPVDLMWASLSNSRPMEIQS